MIKQQTWLDELRQQAIQEYSVLPLPKADKTQIKNWEFEALKLNENTQKIEKGIPTSISHLVNLKDENVIIIQDGVVVYQKLSVNFEGVIISSIQEAITHHEAQVKPYFGKVIPFQTNRLTALNLHYMNSGLFINIPKNKVIEQTLTVFFIQEKQSLMNHNLIVMNQGSQLKYIENYISQKNAIINLNTEVVIGENAQLDLATMAHLNSETVVYECKKTKIERNGRLVGSQGALSDGNVINENLVSLVGSGASAELKTVAISKHTQKQNLTIEIEHLAPYTEGNIVNHGISIDEAQLTFNGIGKIQRGMHGSNAQQSSRAMILSEGARADANPVLLIDEYDVKAGHAAGVGKIDEEQLYYLMSRGLSRREAETLIIHGFLMPFINEIKNEAIQNELMKLIQKKLETR